jgi:hypothetical integral membrane protein (TIGR02206 family)
VRPPDAPPPSLTLADWLRDFHPYTLQHFVSSAFCALVILAIILYGLALRRRPDSDAAEHRFGRAWGVAILIYQAIETAWWFQPGHFSWGKSLPFALCDLAAWTAGLALVTRNRRLRTFLYYWGFCLSSQAMLTPILRDGNGMATARYWFFFIGHTNIVGAAWYDLIVRRFRPTWADWRFAILGTMCYVGLIVPLNIGLDVNYGFMGPSPDQPGVVAFLPPWPWRVHGVIAGGFILFTLATIPWSIARKLGFAHADPGDSV